MFGRLEAVFQSEVAGLGNPRAALLAFSVACMTYNLLAVLQSAVETEHRLEAANFQVSSYYIADEVRTTYSGMMIAVHSVHENFSVPGDARAQVPVIATNVYLRTAAGWRMIVHHASPAAGPPAPAPGDAPPKLLH